MAELNQKEVNEQMYLFVKRWLDDLPFEESKKVPVMAIGYCLARLSKQDELLKEQQEKICQLESMNVSASGNGTAIGVVQGGLVIQKGQNNKHIVNNGTMTMTFGK